LTNLLSNINRIKMKKKIEAIVLFILISIVYSVAQPDTGAQTGQVAATIKEANVPPTFKEPEFLRVGSEMSGSFIEFDLFVENTTSVEVYCLDIQSKKIIDIGRNTIPSDNSYTLEKSLRAKMNLPDTHKEYIYTFVARNDSHKSPPHSYHYYERSPELIISGDVSYFLVNGNDLKVVWDLKSSKNIASYWYNLKIKNGEFLKTISGQIANLKDDKIFQNVFKAGEPYKVNLEVGVNEISTKPVRSDQEIVVPVEKSLDFVPESNPAIIFFNNGTMSGIKVKFQTTKPCLANIEISSSNKNTFVRTGDPSKTNNHEIVVTDALNFISSGNESVSYIKVILTELDVNGTPITGKSKSAIFGLGGSTSAKNPNFDLEKKEKAKETSRKIGEILGSGLKGLVNAVLPIPLG
jgi:hypothetical protein